jgi:hypothetical protein
MKRIIESIFTSTEKKGKGRKIEGKAVGTGTDK